MNTIKNWTKSPDAIHSLDKYLKKAYNKSNPSKTTATAFDDDAFANSALDYLHSNGNRNKTQSFLKNNGFPSAGERQFNKELYGVQTEQKQMRDLLKNKTTGILNPNLPNDTDRAFLKGLMGEKEGERDYQKQITGANRALKDLQDAFRGSQFESVLKPITPSSRAFDEKKYIYSAASAATNPDEHIAFFNSGIKDDITQDFENKTFDEKVKSNTYDDSGNILAYGANKSGSQSKLNGSKFNGSNADYKEFYLTGQTKVFDRLVDLGNAWLNTTDESVRNELHAEAELLRGLARNYKSHEEITIFPAVDALNNVLKNNNAIYRASKMSGVPAAMIASALYRESLFHDPLDHPIAESLIYEFRGDASFGIGQVRTKTAIEAENAFYEAHGLEAPDRTQDEMKALLQTDDATNILYVGFVLWHCGQKLKINIESNYNYARAADVFQMYNPGSEGHGKKVGNYVNAFYNYYKAVRR